jgi:hypothetical protein
MIWWFALLLFYALAFLIVVWPMHWIWYARRHRAPYDLRFYRQASYWRLYFLVFGTALLITLGLDLLRSWLD